MTTAPSSATGPTTTGAGGAVRVADVLRSRIVAGSLRAGDQLSESRLAADLGASRNTLREGFRLLVQERLLVHELNRGVRVRRLGPSDVVDLYAMRRIVEGGAIADAGTPLRRPGALVTIRAAVASARARAAARDWTGVGTANVDFHAGVVALAGSDRLTAAMSQVLAEQRLAFGVVRDLEAFHAPYVADNELICDAVAEGRLDEAVTRLMSYLARAERQLLDAFAADG